MVLASPRAPKDNQAEHPRDLVGSETFEFNDTLYWIWKSPIVEPVGGDTIFIVDDPANRTRRVDTPSLHRIVDTYVPIERQEYGAEYLEQLRRDIAPWIKSMQAEGILRWYAFVAHDASMLDGREPLDGRWYIHLRLEPDNSLDVNEFICRLPPHFLKPKHVHLPDIGGLDQTLLKDDDWAQAWRIHGEISRLILVLLEGHKATRISEQQIFQFLHFVTNPLLLISRCAYFPGGFIPF